MISDTAGVYRRAEDAVFLQLSDDGRKGVSWRRKWQPTPIFLPGESQGRESLVGCCLWGHTESDTSEAKQFSSSSWEIAEGIN